LKDCRVKKEIIYINGYRADDLDICCQGHDPEWPPTGFRWRSSFVKKLLTKNYITVQLYNTRIPCFKIYLIVVHYRRCRVDDRDFDICCTIMEVNSTIMEVRHLCRGGGRKGDESPTPLCRGRGGWESLRVESRK